MKARRLPWSQAVPIPGLLLLGVLSACERESAEPPAIRIGVLVNLASVAGITEAAKLAVSSVNDAGGLDVDGRQHRVELLIGETFAVPGEAVEGARRLIQRDVAAIVGPGRSRDAIAVAELLENARIPMISPTSTHPETTAGKRYVFRVSFTDTFQGEALGRFAAEELGASSAAVLYDVASAYNRNLATIFQRAFEAAGGEMVAVETYTTGESDFKRQLERVRVAAPQVLFLPNYNEEIPPQNRQARELGIGADLLGSDSWTLIRAADLPPLEGSFFGQHCHLDEADTRSRYFVEAFRQAFGHDPTNQAALVWDAFGLLFQAIASAGADPDGIRQALAGTEGFQGVTGAITYRGQGGDPPKPLAIMQIRQGKTVLYQLVEP